MTKMMEKTNLSFSAINKMLENSDPDTKMVAARTTANLALCTDVEVSSSIIDAGGKVKYLCEKDWGSTTHEGSLDNGFENNVKNAMHILWSIEKPSKQYF